MMDIEMITEEITGPGAWLGPEIQNNQSWVMILDEDDVNEIESALSLIKV